MTSNFVNEAVSLPLGVKMTAEEVTPDNTESVGGFGDVHHPEMIESISSHHQNPQNIDITAVYGL